jgi:nitrate reductase gamma subunit
MDSPWDYLEQLLFAVLPYVAVVAFVVLLVARRCRVPPFRTPRAVGPFLGSRRSGERLLFGGGILVILGGHVLALLIPAQVLLWNSQPVRLYVLEVSALAFAVMTLVGLVLTVARCLFSAEARRGLGPCDWLLYALLLVAVASGLFVALLYPWGSSWYATSAVPYLRSLVRLEPDLGYISAMPHLVKLHMLTAWLLILCLPLTRLVQPLIAPEPDEERARAASRVTTAVLLVGLSVSLLALGTRLWGARLPGNQQGYEPLQPIAFSHRLHAGELEIACLYCHADAEKGRHAGIAAAGTCMNCHRFITTSLRESRAEAALAQREKRPPRTLISAELGKLYKALGLNDKLQPDPARPAAPIRWVKVHNLPSYTHFDHRAHVNASVTCQRCHGAVETMERVRQVEDLSMGWCVNCHRDANQNGVAGQSVSASNDCSTCHH